MTEQTIKLTMPIRLAEMNEETGETWTHMFTVGTILPGTFLEQTLTEQDFGDMVALNREDMQDPRKPAVVGDYNHGSVAMGQDARAAGWLVDSENALQMRDGDEGRELWARVKYTKRARKEIKDEEWRYISPEFVPRMEIEGQQIKPKLVAFALTNRPATNLDQIDTTKMSQMSQSTVAKATQLQEVKMTAEELTAAINAAIQPISDRIGKLENPPQETVALSEKEKADTRATGAEKALREHKENQITVAFSEHVKREAISPAQLDVVKSGIMLSEKFNESLVAQLAVYAALPGKDGTVPDLTNAGTGNGSGDLPPKTQKLSLADFVSLRLSEGQKAGMSEGAARIAAKRQALATYSWDEWEKYNEQSEERV